MADGRRAAFQLQSHCECERQWDDGKADCIRDVDVVEIQSLPTFLRILVSTRSVRRGQISIMTYVDTLIWSVNQPKVLVEGYASRAAVDVVAQHAQTSPNNGILATEPEATRLSGPASVTWRRSEDMIIEEAWPQIMKRPPRPTRPQPPSISSKGERHVGANTQGHRPRK